MNLQSMVISAIVTSLAAFAAGGSLSTDELKLLQDPGGWEYIKVSDQDAGIQTQHVCFDGEPHPQQCSGRLMFNPDNTFVKRISIHGQAVDRHGTYQIDDEQISFFDEFGTRDGPYSMDLDTNAKTLVLSMPQVKLELQLESQYKADLAKKKSAKR
jgi:hypothetical protein